MIAILTDEDFNGRIIRGLLRKLPDLDVLTAHDAGLAGASDSAVITWAARIRRVVVTHDLNTMINTALQRVRKAQSMAGLVAVPQHLGIGAVIADLALIATCAEPRDLEGQIWYLPL